MRAVSGVLVVVCGLWLAGGCTQRPAHADNPEAATQDYWLDRPAVVRVRADDYRALWDAAEDARRRFGFEPEIEDYRMGLMTTEPRLSGQFFEPWRDELRTPSAVLESSLAATRRRIQFSFGGSEAEGFWVEPKVVVEREVLGERRLTDISGYGRALGTGRQYRASIDQPAVRRGWFPVGRDAAFERTLANRIAKDVDGEKLAVTETRK